MVSAAEIRAGAAYVELYARTNPLVRGLKLGQKYLTQFGSRVRRMGLWMMGAGGAITTAILGAAKSFASAGDQLHKMSLRTGMSVEMLSALSHAAQIGGTDLETIEKGMKRLEKNANDLQRGLSTAVDAFGEIGVSATDAAGNLKQPEALFKDTIRGLMGIENHTKKAAIAQDLFGRAGMALLPMLHDGEKGLIAVMEEAEKLGLVMTQEDAEAAAALTDAWTRMHSVLGMIWKRIGGAVAPMLTDLADRIATGSKTVIDWVRNNGAMIRMLLKFGAILTATGAGLVVAGTLIILLGSGFGMLASMVTLAGAAIGVLGTVLAAIVSPIGLVVAGVIALGAYWAYTTGAIGKTTGWLGRVFGGLKADALEAFGAIKAALAAGDWRAAAQVLWSLLMLEWTKGVGWLREKWIGFKSAFLEIWDEATFGLAMMFTDAVAGLERVWVEFMTWFMNKWKGAQETIAKGFAWIIAKAEGLDPSEVMADVGRQYGLQAEQREAAAADRLAQIEKDRQARQESLGDKFSAQRRSRDAAAAAELAEQEEKLARAQAAFDEAVGAAKRRRAGGPQAPGTRDRYDGIGDGAGLAAGSKVTGTFSGAVLKYLGGARGDAQERTAKATEETSKDCKKLVKQTRNFGLMYK